MCVNIPVALEGVDSCVEANLGLCSIECTVDKQRCEQTSKQAINLSQRALDTARPQRIKMHDADTSSFSLAKTKKRLG